MKIIIAENYEEVSSKAADDLIKLTADAKRPVVCTASGDSPAGLYKELVKRANQGTADIAGWKFLSLDEWEGLNGNDEGSCRYHLDHQLFQPLNIASERICFFDGRAKDPGQECERIEEFIKKENGIDISILGLGMNGHIGMNEPGTSSSSRTHVAELDPITQQTGQKYFKNQQTLTGGITLGIKTLMESKNIMLLVSGSHKAEITRQILDSEISEKLPATLLKNHPGLVLYLDKAAAKFVQQQIQ